VLTPVICLPLTEHWQAFNPGSYCTGSSINRSKNQSLTIILISYENIITYYSSSSGEYCLGLDMHVVGIGWELYFFLVCCVKCNIPKKSAVIDGNKNISSEWCKIHCDFSFRNTECDVWNEYCRMEIMLQSCSLCQTCIFYFQNPVFLLILWL